MTLKKWNTAILSAVAILLVIIYSRLFGAGPLSWDDGSNIFNNPYYTLHYWRGVWFEPHFGLYVPMTSTIWALLYNLGGGNAWPFRILNLILHIGNTLMVFTILREFARRLQRPESIAPALAAAVFALHPLQVETVAWISGGRDLLATLFALLCILLFMRGKYLATLGIFALALACKPSVVILPALLIPIGVVILHDQFLPAVRRMYPFFILAAMAVIVTRWAQVEHFVDAAEIWQRPILMIDAYRFYVQKFILPFPLSPNYARTSVVIMGDVAGLVLDALLLAAIVVLAWRWKKIRLYAFFAALFVVSILPVSGLVPFGYENISQVADHYVYLAMVWMAGVFMLLYQSAWAKKALIAGGVLTCVWAWASWERAEVWQNDYNLFSDMSRTAPDSYSTAIGMSVALCSQRNEYGPGLEWTDRALKAKPNDIVALANRAYCLTHASRLSEVAQMENTLTQLNIKELTVKQPTPTSSLLASIGSALMQLNRLRDGFDYICLAYRIMPTEPTHTQNLRAGEEILRQNGIAKRCN